MTTYTPKGLSKPGDGDFQDVSVLDGNMDRLDTYGMGPVVCTSTTRPTGTNLWDGMLIYETDTKRLRRYRASDTKWLPVSPTECNILLGGGTVASIPNATPTSAAFTAILRQGDGITYTPASRIITVPYNGLYQFTPNVLFGTSGTGVRSVMLSDIATPGTPSIYMEVDNASAALNQRVMGSAVGQLLAATQYGIYLYQTSGADMLIGASGCGLTLLDVD